MVSVPVVMRVSIVMQKLVILPSLVAVMALLYSLWAYLPPEIPYKAKRRKAKPALYKPSSVTISTPLGALRRAVPIVGPQ